MRIAEIACTINSNAIWGSVIPRTSPSQTAPIQGIAAITRLGNQQPNSLD